MLDNEGVGAVFAFGVGTIKRANPFVTVWVALGLILHCDHVAKLYAEKLPVNTFAAAAD